jgi:ATP synthase protein I
MAGPDDSQWLKAGRFAALGTEFGTIIVAGVLIGYYTDRWLGTEPWLTLLFTLGGLAGALYRLVWMLKRYQ